MLPQTSEATRLVEKADSLRQEALRTTLEESIATYQQAQSLAEKNNETLARTKALLGRGAALTWLARAEEALRVLDEAKSLTEGSSEALRAEILVYHGVAKRTVGDNAEAVRTFKEAADLARGVGDKRVEALALNSIGWAGEQPGLLTAADKRAALETAVRIQRGLADAHDLSMSLCGLGLVVSGMQGPKAAIPYYEEALAIARNGNSSRAMGQALSLLGYAHSSLGDLDKSLAYYEESLPLTRRAGHRIQEPYTTQGIARILVDRGRMREALKYYQEALAVREEINDRRAIGFSLHNVGVAFGGLGDNARAAEYYERALVAHREIGDTLEEATTLLGLASLRLDEGNPRSALELSERALAVYRERKDQLRSTWALRYKGLSLLVLGRYRESIQSYSEALEICRAISNRTDEAGTARWLGTVYALVGDRQEALKHLGTAAAISEELKLTSDLSVALAHTARVQLEMDQADEARKTLERALAQARNTDFPMVEVRVLEALGDWALHTRRPEEAVTHLEQSLETRRKFPTDLDRALLYVKLGQAYRLAGRHTQALEWFKSAMAESQATAAPTAESLALVELMRLSAAQGDRAVAALYGKQAINSFQETRADLRRLSLSAQRAYVDARSQIYRELADLLIADGRLPEAQQVLDLLKEQEFFDFIRRDGSDPADERVALNSSEAASETEYRKIAEETASLGRQRGELLAIRSRTPDEETRLNALEKELASRNRRFSEWLEDVATEFKRAGAGSDRAFHLREAQALMDDLREMGKGAVALYTLVGPERYRVVLITPDARVAAESSISAADLNRRIHEFRQVLENPKIDPRPLGQELYRILIAPIAPALEKAGARTLMWSLDGALRYVSIPALHDGTQYLAERYQSVVFTPASTSRLRDVPTSDWRGLGFGVSRAVGDFSPLPAVADELRGIFRAPGGPASAPLEGRVLLDEQFTEPAFRAGLRERLPVVHIATHFQFQPGNETDSFLLLGDGSRVTLAELRDATNPFSGVELLALSACNTAVGTGDASGAEVEGFAVLAQRQGARSVLASLWAVADASTRLFMQEFYRARVVNRKTKAEALQTAQLALLRGAITVSATGPARGLTPASGAKPAFAPPASAPYAHPYHWAPFMLIGNWR